jgi:hypothetical protein
MRGAWLFVASCVVLLGAVGCRRRETPKPTVIVVPPAPTSSPSRDRVTIHLQPTAIALRLGPDDVGRDCKEGAPGPAIAMKDGDYDFAELGRCLERLKAAHPELGSKARVVADPSTKYEAVIKAMDAARGDGGVLFPDIELGVVK